MGALKAQKRGAPPVFSSSRHKPTSKMVDPNLKGRKYKLGEIVLTPYPAADRKDVNISQGKIVKQAQSRESGYFYKVLLPAKTVDPLGQNVVFPGDGEDRTMIWVSETMLAKATELPESKFYPECVRAKRDHECESYPDCIPSKGICNGGKYDLRVKWVGWLSQYSTWERDNEFDLFGMGFRLQGELDEQFIKLIVDDIQCRLKFFEKNKEDMTTSEKVDIAVSLRQQCEQVDHYIETMFSGFVKKDFFIVDDVDVADGAAAAAPVVLPALFEKPKQDKAPYMGCSMDPECRRQGRGNLKAFCHFCNERGHRKCMSKLGNNVVLEDNQDPEKEAGKAVLELKLVPMMCKICDKHYGRFHRLYFKVRTINRKLNPEKLEDNSDDGSGESDSSNLSSTVASVAMEAGGSTTGKKRKRPTAEKGKEVDE